MCITLALSFYQYDEPARFFNYMILLDVIAARTLKRFVFRRRPSNMLPPRALFMINRAESGFPSMTVVVASTMVYASLAAEHRMSFYTSAEEIKIWVAILGAFLAYLLVSITRIYQGANYPSDCLISLPLIIVIIVIHWMVLLIGGVIAACPICDGTFCYFDAPGSPCTSVVTRSSIDLWSLNPVTNSCAVIIAFALLSILQYPFEYWTKLVYFVPTCSAVWLFQNMLLCPNKGTNYAGVYSPSASDGLPPG